MATIIPVNVQSEDSSKPQGFSPQTVNAQVGDAVFWHNNDKTTQHQPTPDAAKPAFWGPPIPGQNSSSQINLNVAGTISYQDALQSKLTGTIVVATPVEIGQKFGGGAAFSPSPVQVPAGTPVTWINADSRPHQPAPKSGPANAWLAQPVPPGQKSPPVSQFSNVGIVEYADALDPATQGVIQINARLVHQWTFAEPSGSVAKDQVGNANGTLSPTATRVAQGPPNHPAAVHIDGSNGSLVNFGTAVGQFGTNSFSVALWFKTVETYRYFDIVGNRTAGSHGVFFCIRMTGRHETAPPGRITVEVDQNGQNYIPVDSTKWGLNDGQWHHVVAVRDGVSLKLYIDGALSASATGSGVANIANGNPFILGRSLVGVHDKFAPNADYADMRVYYGGMTADQVLLLYQNKI